MNAQIESLNAAPADIARARAFGFPAPDWAQFVAVDRNGEVWAYADRPLPETAAWVAISWNSASVSIGDLEVECPGWRRTLHVRDGGWFVPLEPQPSQFVAGDDDAPPDDWTMPALVCLGWIVFIALAIGALAGDVIAAWWQAL